MSNNGHRILGRGEKLARLRKTITVEIPGADYAVRLQELSIGQMQGIANDIPHQLALMIVDEQGERIYTTDEDIVELQEMSQSVAVHLIRAAAELNGATKEAMETALKNSEASRSGASAGD